MDKLAKTQLSLLAAYSSPFVLLSAILLNITMFSQGITTGPSRLIFLSAAFPIGFAVGRSIYRHRSHVEIMLDENGFQVKKGSRQTVEGTWSRYMLVSIIVDQFSRANIRLYSSADDDYVDLPVSGSGADPQKLRDHIAGLISKRGMKAPILQPVEAS